MVLKGCELKRGKFVQHGYVKFIDFGVAQDFRNKNGNFKSTNCDIGKVRYISPELYMEQEYNAQLNDNWCLGVCLFLMNFGLSPYKLPTKNCRNFSGLIKGDLKGIIKAIEKRKYSSRKLLSKYYIYIYT